MSEYYEEYKYSHICDCCENVRYPLNYISYRTNPRRFLNTETGEITTQPGKVVQASVCDECLPVYEDED